MSAGVGNVFAPAGPRPSSSHRFLTIFFVSAQLQLVVQIILTVSSKTEGARRSLPAPSFRTHSNSGCLAASR